MSQRGGSLEDSLLVSLSNLWWCGRK